MSTVYIFMLLCEDFLIFCEDFRIWCDDLSSLMSQTRRFKYTLRRFANNVI